MAKPELQIEKRVGRVEDAIMTMAERLENELGDFSAEEIEGILRGENGDAEGTGE